MFARPGERYGLGHGRHRITSRQEFEGIFSFLLYQVVTF